MGAIKPLGTNHIHTKYLVKNSLRTNKNERYYLDRLTYDEIKNKTKINLKKFYSDGSTHVNSPTAFTIFSLFTSSSYLYFIPDFLKYIIVRLLVEPLLEPLEQLRKRWILLNALLDAKINKGKLSIEKTLYHWHEKPGDVKTGYCWRMTNIGSKLINNIHSLFQSIYQLLVKIKENYLLKH